MEINDILRASGVTRWHIVRTARQQSLAEHTFDVVMIARAIAKVAGEDDYEITKAALLHDLDEIVSGDIPTPTKKKAREHGWELNDLYKEITGRELTETQSQIVHLADKLADLYFLRDHAIGAHAWTIYDQLVEEWNNLIREAGPLPPKIREAARWVSTQVQSQEFTI